MKLLWRLVYRGYRTVTGLWYWLGRRFSRAGLVILGVWIVSALLGVDTDTTVTYQVFALFTVVLLVAVVGGWRFRLPFTATRVLPRLGTVGQRLTYKVLVENQSTRLQKGLALLEDLRDPRPSFQQWLVQQLADEKFARSFRWNDRRRQSPFRMAHLREAPVPPLLPGRQTEVAMEITPLRRGALRFAGVTLARPDPLGVFRALSSVPAEQKVLILPRRYPLPPLALPGTMKYQEGGVAMASNVGQSDEFVSLRDYRRGDPLRHIHWRSWARTGRPIVKEFEDEFFVRHALVLDTFTEDPNSEVFEEAVSVAASFACAIQTQESLLDLLFVGPEAFCFTSGRGLAQADQMLEILASVQPCTERPFRDLGHQVVNHFGRLSGAVCVLLAWDGPRREFIEQIQAMGVPVLVLVVAARNRAGGILVGSPRIDATRFHVLEAGRIEEGLAKL